jgi:hypothetical protein
MLRAMRIAASCVVVVSIVALAGCGFDTSGQSDQGGSSDDSSVSGGDGIFPTDDGATRGDTSADTHGAPIDTGHVDTTPEPDTTPTTSDTCIGDGGPCVSPGHCATGTYKCNGACSALDPPTFGETCTSPKSCSSAYACDGSCPDPPGVGGTCSKDGCSNGTVQCDLSCALLPTAHSACVALSCAVPVYADCYGMCPPKSSKSGLPCVTCVCGGGTTVIGYDDCGACPGCPSGCTEGDAGTGDVGHP